MFQIASGIFSQKESFQIISFAFEHEDLKQG